MKTTTQNHSIVRRAAFACAMLALLAPHTRAADAIKPPIIQSLSVSPRAIESGTAARLNWSATGATSVTVTADHDAKPGKISGHGLTVWPTVTTTYTVTAVNAAGTSVRTITIPVTEPAPQAWLGVISTGAPAGIGRALK